MKKTIQYFTYIPFEGATALYVIANGILTLNQDSMSFSNLWNMFGSIAVLYPLMQILSGILILFGVRFSKSNVEGAGLILASSSFLIKSFSLLTDGDITLSDINFAIQAVLITFAAMARITHIVYWTYEINKRIAAQDKR